MSISETSKQFLLNTARKVIENRDKNLKIDKENVPDDCKETRAVFVTLTKNGELRGCIGHLEPIQEIYKDVIDNAFSAAFRDPRFEPLESSELDEIKIEISILSLPKKLDYVNSNDLLEKLNVGKDGVIISKGAYGATFLPQVWEQLPEKEDFLSHLCSKAGLKYDEWKLGKLEVEIYSVECFEE